MHALRNKGVALYTSARTHPNRHLNKNVQALERGRSASHYLRWQDLRARPGGVRRRLPGARAVGQGAAV